MSSVCKTAALFVCALLLGTGCAQGQVMRGKIEGLQKIADQAERNGAVRCAPRELAMAKSHLRFALLELDEGFMTRATAHLDLAEPNAQAAYDLSPPQVCAERGFVVAKPGDKDGDGYLDPEDKCPEEPETWNGYKDEDGCPDDPDTDNDGIPDSKDSCVLDPEDKDGYLDDDGCPEPDNDLDGILDDKDKSADGKSCANDPEDPDGFEDQDGCPEPDNDVDTVLDNDDMCPNEKGEPGGDRPGCPKKPSLAIITDTEIKILQQIHFEFDKDKIRPESYPIVDAVADILKQNPKVKIEVQGHTDNKGSAAYNLKLSDRRANAVMKALIQRGIDKDRLRAKGYGMTRPIVPNDSEQNRALNRRSQFVRTESETH
ncbi:MAG: OmpA family protein [Deltaproteobacteria bacterium]|nr:OmpA family protein [Deltaproteobacteria bacterium]